MCSHTDHLGNTFENFNSMCEYWGKKPQTVTSRLGRGYNLETALTKVVSRKNCGVQIEVTDHLGQTFSSFRKMCKHYGKESGLVRNRLNRGISLEDALTTEPYKVSRVCKKVFTDHLGNEYSSIREAADAHGINKSTLYRRIEQGWSKEEAFTSAKLSKFGISPDLQCVDHEGNVFSCKKEMATYYGISLTLLCKRLERGFDLEDALTVPVRTRRKTPKKKARI